MERRWTSKGLWGMAVSLAGTAMLAAGVLSNTLAAPQSNIRETPHNLSRNGKPNDLSNIRAPLGGETAVCAFCHTPHGASTTVKGPLWNRNASDATYNRYTSSSMDGNYMFEGFTNQPAGSSLLCLSCHDGMVALGSVNNLLGSPQTINLANTNGGKMPAGPQGALSGFTRLIGTDLTNDHPVSVTYNDALAAQDGEMVRLTSNLPEARDLINGRTLGIRSSGFKPLLPLEPTGIGGIGQVQCGTCHDPHLAGTNNKFLRANRFQVVQPTGGNFEENSDQICLACHTKLTRTWAESAHANPTVADEAYTTDAATRRNFPAGTKVWQAACLNCHDTHTAQGARRLLREGVQSGTAGTGSGTYRIGSAITPADTTSSIENTCYQCHDASGSATRVIGTATGSVPDIKNEFLRMVRMPISTTEQLRNKREVHDIFDSDFIESPELLGKNNPENRHVECTDCHNPHRVRRNAKFYGTSADSNGASRTHVAGGTKTTDIRGADGNVASGVLRGAWGVEPRFGPTTSTWPQLPVEFIVKKGDPGLDTSYDRNKTYMTREYQLCFKCHSNYSNSDDLRAFPPLGNTAGGTSGSHVQRNYVTRYTNVAAEFGSVRATDPPSSSTDQGEVGNDPRFEPNGSPPSGGSNNHRSWHPVMWPTGRTSMERTNTADNFSNIKAPFNTKTSIGYQTMYCSDCHGDSGSWTMDSGPNNAVTQGPHGSRKKFLLKGDWDIGTTSAGPTPGSPAFCGNCHQPSTGAGGFRTGDASHSSDKKSGKRCTFCHIAVPHGWKNKAFLVNLLCVGTEAGYAPGCTPITGTSRQIIPPYYINALLRVNNWQRSTGWENTGNCMGGESGMQSACENN